MTVSYQSFYNSESEEGAPWGCLGRMWRAAPVGAGPSSSSSERGSPWFSQPAAGHSGVRPQGSGERVGHVLRKPISTRQVR